MKKWLALGAPLLAATAGAWALRCWQRRADFDGDGLLSPGPASAGLVALVLLAGAGFLLLIRALLREPGPRGYLAAFALPHRGLVAVYLLAGGLLVAAGLLGLRDQSAGLSAPLSTRVLSVALVPTGLDLALVGWLGAQRQEAQGRFAWPLLLPGWCGCVWLISAYQAHTAQPSAMGYAFYFLGALCAVGACYMIASFSFERPRPRWAAWLCAMGILLLATAVADAVETGDAHQGLVCLGYMIYLAAQLSCLLYRAQTPAQLEPWTPPPAEKAAPAEGGPAENVDPAPAPSADGPENNETEVSEHE